MAASIVRGRVCLKLPKYLYRTTVRHYPADTGPYGPYFVLLPEIPEDTPETNPVLNYREFTKWSDLKPDNLVTGGAKAALDYDVKFGLHANSLKDQKKEKTFESVFHPIEEISVRLLYALIVAANMKNMVESPDLDKVFERVDRQIGSVTAENWLNEPMYRAVKELLANSDKLTPYQKRLAEFFERNAVQNGIELTGIDRKKIFEVLGFISIDKFSFRYRVDLCEQMFSYTLHNFNIIKDMPPSVVRTMSEDKVSPTRGPWTVTLTEPSYSNFMRYCNDRMTRWNIWHAYNNRASQIHASSWLDNIESLEKLRLYRDDLSKLLGYKHFIDYSMAYSMAGTAETVVNMMDTFKQNFQQVAEQEIKTLQEFAAADKFPHKLQMWDVPYYRRKHETQTFRLNRDEISEYFPLPKVLSSLFDLCTTLFGITFKQRNDVDTWHPDVSVYDVFEEGQYTGTFFYDPYNRSDKRLQACMTGRIKSDVINTKPIVYLSTAVWPSYVKTEPALMSLEDVVNLYWLFGALLTEMLPRVPYLELAGYRNMETDAIEIGHYFMTYWATQPEYLQRMSSHYETGKTLPDDVTERLLGSNNHMFAFDLMHECYLSMYDFECHMGQEDWDDTMRNVWKIFMPIEMDIEDRSACSFHDIFSGQRAGAYYSGLWARMVSRDMFEAFKEGGLENKANLETLGRRYRETYLAHGAGLKASEVFRQFRGRDPSLKPFIDHHKEELGLIGDKNSQEQKSLNPAMSH